MVPLESPINPKLTEIDRQSFRKSKMSKIPSTTRVVAYLPNLKTILQRLRATSATPSSLGSTLLTTTRAGPLTARIPDSIAENHQQKQPGSSSPFTDILASPLTCHLSLHPTLPLPGAVGLSPATPPAPSTTTTSTSATPPTHTPHNTKEEGPVVMSTIKDKPQGTVECMVQEIPEFLVPDLMLLFPGVSIQGEGLNLITLSQHTQHDMTSWSAEVEQEREQLLEHFVGSAKEICSRLNGAGFWADFIDPSSGRATFRGPGWDRDYTAACTIEVLQHRTKGKFTQYYSAYSSATLFETDDTFRFFGFDIVDFGCCKCVHHPVWGTFTFVGTIFTSAPTSSPAIQSIMEL